MWNESTVLFSFAFLNLTPARNKCMGVASVVPDYYYTRVESSYFYTMGVVIPAGLVFNLFSLLIFTLSRSLRRTTTAQYLAALACADSLFLIGDLGRWISTPQVGLGIELMHRNGMVCKMSYTLRYGGKLVSAWITVAIVLERLLTVTLPLRVSRISTALRARCLIIAIYVAGFTLGLYPIWTLSVRKHETKNFYRCVINDGSEKAYATWTTWVLRIGTLGVPGIIISTITIIIVITLFRAAQTRRHQMEGQSARMPSLPAHVQSEASSYEVLDQRIPLISKTNQTASGNMTNDFRLEKKSVTLDEHIEVSQQNEACLKKSGSAWSEKNINLSSGNNCIPKFVKNISPCSLKNISSCSIKNISPSIGPHKWSSLGNSSSLASTNSNDIVLRNKNGIASKSKGTTFGGNTIANYPVTIKPFAIKTSSPTHARNGYAILDETSTKTSGTSEINISSTKLNSRGLEHQAYDSVNEMNNGHESTANDKTLIQNGTADINRSEGEIESKLVCSYLGETESNEPESSMLISQLLVDHPSSCTNNNNNEDLGFISSSKDDDRDIPAAQITKHFIKESQKIPLESDITSVSQPESTISDLHTRDSNGESLLCIEKNQVTNTGTAVENGNINSVEENSTAHSSNSEADLVKISSFERFRSTRPQVSGRIARGSWTLDLGATRAEGVGLPRTGPGKVQVQGGTGYTSRAALAERQLSMMLIGVCLAFVLLRLPYTITYYVQELKNSGGKCPVPHTWPNFWLTLTLKVTDCIASSNYLANFFLYCLCGSYFRQQIVVVFRGQRRPSTTGCSATRSPGRPGNRFRTTLDGGTKDRRPSTTAGSFGRLSGGDLGAEIKSGEDRWKRWSLVEARARARGCCPRMVKRSRCSAGGTTRSSLSDCARSSLSTARSSLA